MRSRMLTGYFSLLSLGLLLLAGALLTHFVYRHQVQQMEHLAQDRNVLTTRVFQNLLLADVEHIAASSAWLPREALPARPEIAALHRRLQPLLAGTDIVKVKIYAPSGLTIFSTDPTQIGEDKSDNAGFRSALAGVVASELTHRDQFSGFDGVRSNLDLVSSYLPVYDNDRLVAVFELYQEVTNLMGEIRDDRFAILGMVALVLGVLFLFQWVVVRRAQQILSAHEAELESDKAALGARVEAGSLALAASEDRIRHLSTHDQLTGLPNRGLLFEAIRERLALARRADEHLALALIDLDHFSRLNDTLGHETGDRLLNRIAAGLDEIRESGDTLARVGGDEFVLLIGGLSGQNVLARHAVRARCERLLALLGMLYRVPQMDLAGSASIGIALVDQAGADPEELLKQAEIAMYHAKQSGRNRCALFEPGMAERVHERTRLEGQLRRALREGELVLHYQPQVDADSGRVLGAEVLVRWQHPEDGLVPPGEFIPLAEETGLILPLGEWVLETACRQLAAWNRQPAFAGMSLAVNVSVQQFCQPGFAERVIGVLAASGADPLRLKLELTESLFADDLDGIVATMQQLHSIGIRFSLDDFGTGYSSLAYLSRLPLAQLKIDRAFVSDIGCSDGEVPICAAIISLARALDLQVVAEGVETEVQRYYLSRLHRCDELQGYLISRPLALPEFEEFVARSLASLSA